MRRVLQAQAACVRHTGIGPAEFERQRRFPVYPSLEEYAQTLQEDFQDQDTPDIGRVFGGRQTPDRSPASTSAGETEEPQPPRALPGSPLAERASDMQSEDQRTTGESVAEEHAPEFPLAPPAPVPHTDEIIQPANVPPQEDDAPTSATPAPKGAGENDVETAAIHPLSQG